MDRLVCHQTDDERELKQAFKVRKLVFIREQGISEHEEWDGLDGVAVQFVAEIDGKIIGTARLRFPEPDCAKIERMAVLKVFRRQGVGRQILNTIEEYLRQRQLPLAILHAQWTAIPFYQSCGYVGVGKPFCEAEIKHLKMQKEL